MLARKLIDLIENLPQALRNLILSITNPTNRPFACEMWTMEDRSQITAADTRATYSADGIPLDTATVEIITSWLKSRF